MLLPPAAYETSAGGNVVDCTETNLPKAGEVCRFSAAWFKGACSSAESWGYNKESPCIILKLNKVRLRLILH